MDANERSELIAAMADSKTRIVAMGTVDDDWEQFQATEKARAAALSDDALKAELKAEMAQWLKADRLARKVKVLRETFAERKSWLSARAGEAQNKLERNPPPILAAAISRMEKLREFARTLGVSQFTFSSGPGGDALSTARGRTASDEAATQRIETALQKLRGLAFVDCDLERSIAEIVAAADIPGIWSSLPATPPPAPTFDQRRDKLKATSISNGVYATIEPDNEPRRERLLPAG